MKMFSRRTCFTRSVMALAAAAGWSDPAESKVLNPQLWRLNGIARTREERWRAHADGAAAYAAKHGMKTISLPWHLYKAACEYADENGMTVEAVVEEANKEWLTRFNEEMSALRARLGREPTVDEARRAWSSHRGAS